MGKIWSIDLYYKFFQHLLKIVVSTKEKKTANAWEMFKELFFTILEQNFSKLVKPQKVQYKSEFEKMMGSKTASKLLMGLKNSIPDILSYSNSNSFDVLPEELKTTFSAENLSEIAHSSEHLFEVMHLMHEDLKLNMFRTNIISGSKIAEFLFKFCLKLGPTKFNYSEFYVGEYPKLAQKYHKEYESYVNDYKIQLSDAKVQMEMNMKDSNSKIPDILSKNLLTVPSIYSWIENKLDRNQVMYDTDFFCFFETTRKVCRLFDIFSNENTKHSRLHPLLAKPEDESMDIEPDMNFNSFPILGISDEYLPSPKGFNSPDYLLQNRNLNYFERIVFCLKEERMGRDFIKKLPLGVSLPIQEVLSHDYFKTIYVKSTPSEKKFIEDWPKEIFRLIEREDLYYNLNEIKKNRELSEEQVPDFQFSRVSTLNLAKNISSKRRSTLKLGRTESNVFDGIKKSIVPGKKNDKSQSKAPQRNDDADAQEYLDLIEKEFKSLGIKNNNLSDITGNVSEGHFINYRFSSDLRYMEVCLMLDSNIPFKLRIDKVEGIEQMNPQDVEQRKLMMHENGVIRQFAKCIGRGALKLGTLHTAPTEKLTIPDICTTALLPPENKKHELREDNQVILGWSNFHNGVATGLQLATEFDPASNHIKNWILYHKPPQAKNEFGGFLMSMGLHGYLKNISSIDIYQFMKSKHEAYTVGLCIGGGVSLIGTCDHEFSKACLINLEYCHPRGIDIEIYPTTQ